MTYRVLSLFAGIGGFDLGLERTGGFKTVAFCEINPYCQRVLRKHWPEVPVYDDVRTLTADALRRDGIAVDIICGGFPCQDVSFAGKRAGLEGERSGLWGEYRRLIGELRPRFVIVENVPGLLSLGMGTVLGDLSALRYDAVWDCVSASAVGAPHRRDRVWVVAHSASERPGEARQLQSARPKNGASRRRAKAADADSQSKHAGALDAEMGRAPQLMANADCIGTHGAWSRSAGRHEPSYSSGIRNANVSGLALREGQSRDVGEELKASVGADWWFSEPDVGRVAHGIPARVDRLRSLGNAVVPQIPELIGRAILAADAA